jgi:hypothetical protein
MGLDPRVWNDRRKRLPIIYSFLPSYVLWVFISTASLIMQGQCLWMFSMISVLSNYHFWQLQSLLKHWKALTNNAAQTLKLIIHSSTLIFYHKCLFLVKTEHELDIFIYIIKHLSDASSVCFLSVVP